MFEKKKAMVAITTSIPIELRDEARRKGISFQSLVIKGWHAMHGEPVLSERLGDMEKNIARLQERLTNRDMEVWKLQDELKKVQK